MSKFDKYLYPGIIIALLMVILFLKVDSCNKIKQLKANEIALNNAMNDTLMVYRTKDSASMATISIIQTSSAEAFEELLSSDATVKELQQQVAIYKSFLKEVGSSATDLESTIDVGKTTATELTSDGGIFTFNNIPGPVVDTTKEEAPDRTSPNIFPVYNTSYTDDWIDYDIAASKDSTHLDFHTTDKYSLILGYKDKKPFADVTNYNPYSTIKTLRTFQVTVPKPVPKRWGIGLGAGVGVNNDFKLKPQVNLGISYNFINF